MHALLTKHNVMRIRLLRSENSIMMGWMGPLWLLSLRSGRYEIKLVELDPDFFKFFSFGWTCWRPLPML